MTDPMSPEELRACRERYEREADSTLRYVAKYHDTQARGASYEIHARYQTAVENARTDVPRLLATADAAQREAASLRHAALLAAGIHGGPGAWRWASDPTGTILDDVAAWERLLGEMREATASPTPAIYCPNCEATGFPPSGHAWPSLEPWWIDGAKLCCTECGACLVVRADGERASLALDEPEPAERKPVAGWEVGHVPGYSARRAAPILRRGPICVRATESGWEMIAESDEDDVESIQITSDSAASLEAAQLAAEDALRAIADQINGVLGPALTAAEIDASEKAEAEADMRASND